MAPVESVRKRTEPLQALERMRPPRTVVAAKEKRIRLRARRVREDCLERRQAAVNVVKHREHAPLGSHT